MTSSAGLRLACTCLIVLTRSVRPSSAKYSHCIGTITPWAQASPLSVSRLRLGGQSIRIEVVVGVDRGQRRAQALVAPFEADQLDLGAGQLAVGAEHVVAALRARPSRLGDRGALEQHVVDAQVERALVDARAHGRVALRVEIDEQDASAESGQAGGEVDGGRRLADAALLVRNAEDCSSLNSR